MFKNSCAAIILCFAFCRISLASDHIDGPVTMQDQVSDLTDLFAFSTQEQMLTLVMDSYPFLLRRGHFTNQLSYDFVVRQARIAGTGEAAAIGTRRDSEARIECRFSGDHGQQTVTCVGPNGFAVGAKVGEIGVTTDKTTRVFAGPRADPFFFSAPWTDKVRLEGFLPKRTHSNSVSKTNILSIILEFPVAKLFQDDPGSLFAIAAETVAIESGQRLDRVGRPEITNFGMQMPNHENGHQELRDRYNKLELFDNSPSDLADFRARLMKRILEFDGLDGRSHWPAQAGKLDALVKLLLDDFLVIDIGVNCGESDSYFSIEESLLEGRPERTCGGRKLTDDFVDQQLTLYIHANELSRIGDGADEPYKTPLKTFPYMAAPDRSVAGAIKRKSAALAGAALRRQARKRQE